MKIYLLSQDYNTGYDTYDSCVVCAKNEDDAKKITPYGREFEEGDGYGGAWAIKLSQITCEELGNANKNQKRGLIVASFNAG